MILGRYPDDAVKLYGAAMPAIRAGDMETIKQPLDFLGATLYSADPVRRGKDGKPEVIPWPAGYPITGFEWAVTPSILRLVPTWLHERYKLPIVIAENGLSVRDWVAADGGVHDPDRIDFMARYLRELAAAIAAGVPIEAYFHWSILDNFEWAEGYKHRFGLVYVNYETQERTIKDSGKWYRDVIASNGRNVLAADGARSADVLTYASGAGSASARRPGMIVDGEPVCRVADTVGGEHASHGDRIRFGGSGYGPGRAWRGHGSGPAGRPRRAASRPAAPARRRPVPSAVALPGPARMHAARRRSPASASRWRSRPASPTRASPSSQSMEVTLPIGRDAPAARRLAWRSGT